MTAKVDRTHRAAHIPFAYLVAFSGFLLLYLLSASSNHSTAGDAYSFANNVMRSPLDGPPNQRLFLWQVSMQSLYSACASVFPGVDPFKVAAVANSIQLALAVVLFHHLLHRRLGHSATAAWISAALMGSSYGLWRYAAEMEVYSMAALLSVALLNAAFAFSSTTSVNKLIALAIFAGLVALAYQPLGFIGAVAVPIYLAFHRRLRDLILYFAVSGLVVLAGLIVIQLMSSWPPTLSWQVIFDTDGKPLILPSLMDTGETFVGIAQNLISVNWAFAFEPTRSFIEASFPVRLAEELHAAGEAPAVFMIFIVTIPFAIFLIALGFVRLTRGGSPGFPLPETLAVTAWFFLHLAMVLLIDPGGFEASLPILVPLWTLLAIFVVRPLVEHGGRAIGLALVAVFLLHNSFAGVGVFSASPRDYLRDRGEPIVNMAGPNDLIVTVWDWAYYQYFIYRTDTPVMLLRRNGPEEITASIGATMEQGGSVYFADDIAALAGSPIQGYPGLENAAREIWASYASKAEPLDLNGFGRAYRVNPL